MDKTLPDRRARATAISLLHVAFSAIRILDPEHADDIFISEILTGDTLDRIRARIAAKPATPEVVTCASCGDTKPASRMRAGNGASHDGLWFCAEQAACNERRRARHAIVKAGA